MKYILIFLSIFIYLTGFTQTDPGKFNSISSKSGKMFNDGSITGFVYDRQSKTPLEGVTIQIFNKTDSVLAGGASTDAEGFFEISDISQGSYTLNVNLTGYNKYSLKMDLTEPDSKNKKIDTVYLNSGTVTDEISVEADKPFMELKGEKKIFNVAENMSVKGGTAIDILKNLPSVTVDIDNNVSLRGNSSIKYFINGRPVTGNIARILEQLPSDQVNSVEVITNPSAKFDAEGSTGVINLVLKDFDDGGLNGQLDMSSGSMDNYGTGLNLNYKTKDYKVSGSYDMRIRTRFFNAAIDRDNFFSTDEAFTNQTSDGRMRMEGNNAKFEFEYYPSLKDVLNFNVRYGKGNRNRGDTDNLQIFDASNSLLQVYKSTGNEIENNEEYSFGLNYFRSIEKSIHTITGDISYSSDKEYENENKQTDYTLPANLETLFSRIDGSELNKQFNAQIDYQKKFSKTSGFESGIKFNNRNTDTDNLNYNKNNSTGAYELDTALTDDFLYNENISAAYLIYTGEAGDLSYNLGLRGENWNYSIDQYLFNSNTSRNISDIFPSAGVAYKFSLTDQVGVNYSRKVRRPGYRQLSPVTRVFSPVFYSKGNPDLKPEYINAFELNYSKFFNSFSVIPSLFYNHKSDAITRTSELIDSNIVLNTSVNANSEVTYGGELLVNGAFSKAINLNASLSYYHQDINSDSLGNNSNNTFSGRIFSNISLPFDAGIQLTYFYSGKSITPQGTMDPINSFDVALRKDFLDDKLNLNLKFSDIFNTAKFSGTSNTELYSQTFSRARVSRLVTLSLSYKFGSDNSKQDRKKRRQQDENSPEPEMDF
ncbi:MAG: TonB-dependent receptor [Ignavibacteria bacterium]|nr:TonB-dependent receptor [Ignavibacteria bacterium]